MTRYQIFIIRIILGGVIAVILTRMFFGSVNIIFVIGLAIILVGLAYLSEYLKKK